MTIFDELINDKKICSNNINYCIQQFKQDLETYFSKKPSDAQKILKELINENTAYAVEAIIDNNNEGINDIILRGFFLTMRTSYEKLKLQKDKLSAETISGYKRAFPIEKLPGDYQKVDFKLLNEVTSMVSKEYKSGIQIGGMIEVAELPRLLNDPSHKIDDQTDEQKLISNMRALYDFSAQLYNNDVALKFCNMMMNPITFSQRIKDSFRPEEQKEILEYFFTQIPTIPDDASKLTDSSKLNELYFFTSQRINDESSEIYEKKGLTILKYEDCLLDTTIFKKLYDELFGPLDGTVGNNSLFFFNFRVITNVNNIINKQELPSLMRNPKYFSIIANLMYELQYKNTKFSTFLKDESNISIINKVYDEVMKDIVPVYTYIKANKLPVYNPETKESKEVDTVNPRYTFDPPKFSYDIGKTGKLPESGKAYFNANNYTSFFKNLELTYENCPYKIGYNNNIYDNTTARNNLKDIQFKNIREKYNLGKINGFYEKNQEAIDDPNCAEIILKKIDNGENIIMLALGASGSGKTVTMIQLKKPATPGIIPSILNKLDNSYVKIKISIADIYFNWDPNLKSMKEINHKHYNIKPIIYNGIKEFTFTKIGEDWVIFLDDDIKRLEEEVGGNNLVEIEEQIEGIKKLIGKKLGEVIIDLIDLREIEPTKNNPESSRSHCKFKILIHKEGQKEPHSKIDVCDLAGVEDEFVRNALWITKWLDIYRNKSSKYKHDDQIDHKLYFDNYTCFNQYQSKNQTEFLQNKEKEEENLTIKRAITIHRLYKLKLYVDFQLEREENKNFFSKEFIEIDYKKISDKDSFDKILEKNKIEYIKYDDIIHTNLGYKCIKPDKEEEIRTILQNLLIKTSGSKKGDIKISESYKPGNLVEDYFKFYNLQETDTFEDSLKKMFSLFNIYMQLFQFLDTVINYRNQSSQIKGKSVDEKLRDEAIEKLKTWKGLENFIDSKYTDIKNIPKKLFFNLLTEGIGYKFKSALVKDEEITAFSLLRGITMDSSSSSNAKNSLYVTSKETDFSKIDLFKNNYPKPERKNKKLPEGDWLKEIRIYTSDTPGSEKLSDWVKPYDIFKSNSLEILYRRFLDKVREDASLENTRLIAPIYLKCVRDIIYQIVSDIIKFCIIDFNIMLRTFEGKGINASLEQAQEVITKIIQRELNTKMVTMYESQIKNQIAKKFPKANNIADKLSILNYFSPSSDNFSKSNNLFNDFNFRNLAFDKNISIPGKIEAQPQPDDGEIIWRIALDSGDIPDSGNIHDEEPYRGFGLYPLNINSKEKQIIDPIKVKPINVIIFTVINMTDNGITNNPPNPPFINTNKLKKIINVAKFYENLLLTNLLKDDKIKTIILKNLNTLDIKFQEYGKKFMERLFEYDFYKKNQQFIDLKRNIDSNYNTTFCKIAKKIGDKVVSVEDQKKLIDIIDSIDGNNKSTLIGTVLFDPYTKIRDPRNYTYTIHDGVVNSNESIENYVSSNPRKVANYEIKNKYLKYKNKYLALKAKLKNRQ